MDRLGPYELNTIACGECARLMEALPDECIDLTVTSPPYDEMDEELNLIPTLRDYNGYSLNFGDLARQLYRVTKPGGVVVWVVGDATVDGSETLTSFRQALYFREIGFNLWDTMYWEKLSRIPTESRYYNVIEYMFVFSKGQINTLNFIRDHKNVTAGAKKRKDKVINKGRNEKKNGYLLSPQYSRRSNLWGYPTGQHDDFSKDHPAIFPEALARDHIISWSNPGDIVFDPMCGSGTVPKMAQLLGRLWFGIDISEEYCDLARRRVANVEAQPFLIAPGVEAEPEPEQLPLLEDHYGVR